MKNWLNELCGATFMPHGQCYLWQPEIVWLHAVSDTLIALAYYSIPLLILYFVRHRRDLPFPKIFLMFGAFIVACGTTHVMEVITIWRPFYWFEGGLKFATAMISLASAVALVRVVPAALQLPSPEDLRRLNASLEERVATRTADLTAANEKLRREMTQRTQAEAEVSRLNRMLEERVAELQGLFDLIPVGVGIGRDPECREIRTNRAFAAMLGIAPEANASLTAPAGEAPATFRIEQEGRLLVPLDLPMQRAARENRPVLEFEETIVHADGHRVEVVVNALPIRDDAGRVTGVVGTFQDVTARKHAEQARLDFERRLLETQKLESIGILAGGIAHDFNNLLTAMLGNASLIRLGLAPTEVEKMRLVGAIETAARRAAELCKQLLAYAGQAQFVVQPLSLNFLVEDHAPLLKLSLSKMAELRLDLEQPLRRITGDAAQIRQVLMNLVINASEAIGDRPGVIVVRTRHVRLREPELKSLTFGVDLTPGWFVCLEVSDDGCGMEAATIARMFEPFFTTKFIGRGLGLSALLGIMRGHRGGIRVASTPGKGTNIQLLFGALEDTGLPFPVDSRPPVNPVKGRGTILLVDDETYVLELERDALVAAGFKVEFACDGVEAIAVAKAKLAELAAVVLDVRMPRMGGEETLFVLRQLAPKLPVILASGLDEREVFQRYLDRGLAGYIAKPFSAEALVHQVVEAIRQARHAG